VRLFHFLIIYHNLKRHCCAMLCKRGLCRHAVSICPSVRLPRSWILSKWVTVSSKFFYRRVATPL